MIGGDLIVWSLAEAPNTIAVGIAAAHKTLSDTTLAVCVQPMPGFGSLTRTPAVINSVVCTALSEAAAGALTRGALVITVPEHALLSGESAAFSCSVAELRFRGKEIVRALSAARSPALAIGASRFPIRSARWELEDTDPAREPMCQLPGGEVFAHLDCQWTGILPALGTARGRFVRLHLALKQGEVCDVTGCDDEPQLVAALMRRHVTELGIGINRGVAATPVSWAEKAAGRFHIGLGESLFMDVAPPHVHCDVLLEAGVSVVDQGDGCGAELPLL